MSTDRTLVLVFLLLLLAPLPAKASAVTQNWKAAMTAGARAREQQNLSLAREEFERALCISGNDEFLSAVARRQLADCLKEQGDYTQASLLYSKDIQQRSPNDFCAVGSLLGLAECADELGRRDNAEDYLNRARVICSDPTVVHDRKPDGADVIIAVIRHHARGNEKENLVQDGELLRRCINKTPGNRQRIFRAAMVSRKLREFAEDEARFKGCAARLNSLRSEILKEAQNIDGASDPCVVSWILRCETNYQVKATNPQKFLAEVDVIIRQMKSTGLGMTDPQIRQMVAEKVQVHHTLAMRYWQSQHFAQAKEAFDNWCLLVPEDPAGYVARGNFLWARGQNAEAISDLSRAVRLGSMNPMCYTTLGHCYSSRTSSTKAKQYYRRALELLPTDHNALWGLGELCAASGSSAQAVEYYDRAIQIVPKDGRLFVRRAECKYESGDTQGAKDDLSVLLKLAGNDDDVVHRAAALERKLRALH